MGSILNLMPKIVVLGQPPVFKTTLTAPAPALATSGPTLATGSLQKADTTQITHQHPAPVINGLGANNQPPNVTPLNPGVGSTTLPPAASELPPDLSQVGSFMGGGGGGGGESAPGEEKSLMEPAKSHKVRNIVLGLVAVGLLIAIFSGGKQKPAKSII